MDYTIKYSQWIQQALSDPDLAEELTLIQGKDEEIEDRFYRELEFGTGGLRGIIGAGTNRMNVYVVSKATQGYSRYLKEKFTDQSVAIAYDSRIKSRLFAETAAGVFAANGIRAHIFSKLMPTPTLSFAIRQLGCSGGIVITASHNPSKYNGYKVYGPDGCQITTQTAADITTLINEVDTFKDVRAMSFEEGLKKGLIQYIGAELVADYLAAVSQESLERSAPKEISIVYSPLNGSGISCVPRCLEQNGFTNISIPASQREPDGYFPTCPYPNPEMEEALIVAIGCAREIKAELVLATDPDCDRVGAAVRAGADYVLINGNQMGILLLDYVCRMRKKNGTMPDRPLAIKTIVTTELAEKVASHYGVTLVNTLTGFKYIGEQIGYLEASCEESRYIFGFEESYGYLSSTRVRDKDAVNASLLICEMFAWYKWQEITLVEALDSLYEKFGFYTEKLLSFNFEGSLGFRRMMDIMAALRKAPPTEIAGRPVQAAIDYNEESTGLPPSDVLQYKLLGGSVVTVRPSGTEPKLKIYLSACGVSRKASAAIVEQQSHYFSRWISEH